LPHRKSSLVSSAPPRFDIPIAVALESAIEWLRHMKELVVIAGPLPEPRSPFDKSNLEVAHEHVFLANTLDEEIRLAQDLILLSPSAASTPPRARGGSLDPFGRARRAEARGARRKERGAEGEA
jgi:hypothetical protein